MISTKGSIFQRNHEKINFWRCRSSNIEKYANVKLFRKLKNTTPTPSNSVEQYITTQDISFAIEEAKESVKTFDKADIAAKWDIVHELWIHYQKQENKLMENQNKDVLDVYCEVDFNGSMDECRTYDL